MMVKMSPGPGLFINEHALSIAHQLFLDLQQPLPLQASPPGCKPARDVGGGSIQLDQLSQQRFGRFPG